MKGEARAIYQMFDGSDTKLTIPVYQRNYDWKVANCQQLFNDLVAMVREKRTNCFFGKNCKKASFHVRKLAFSFALIWLNVHPRAGIILVPWR